LFNRYCHWGYTDPDGFRKWYTHTYHLDEEQQKASILNLFKIEKNEEIFAKFPYFAWLYRKKVVSLQPILKV
jgi:hypothetical protein